MILKPDDRPALFPGKMQKLYALDHIHRVGYLCLSVVCLFRNEIIICTFVIKRGKEVVRWLCG